MLSNPAYSYKFVSVILIFGVSATWILFDTASSQEKQRPQVTTDPLNITPDSVKWSPCRPDAPDGCEVAVLRGDPTKEPSDVLIRLPKSFVGVKHWHSNAEQIVGVKGKLTIPLEGGKELVIGPGTYGYIPAGMIHQGRCGDEEDCLFYVMRDKPADFNPVK